MRLAARYMYVFYLHGVHVATCSKKQDPLYYTCLCLGGFRRRMYTCVLTGVRSGVTSENENERKKIINLLVQQERALH